ncbi:DUF3618 domain-containing protein [Galbitalea sp. SE-J8]|uniref:DUF3618 domain-containing protein n=1 Tax=Galbitalea sp. SE-J8 TaxID=3054952 RepID=UPI00259C6D4A|nr:DUF3618 domain-containing protein [Galbitalea sp. SE-J8]MDM4763325.1 DUF3618 domain-containing protein [Galbitalea sp. SE-J8]
MSDASLDARIASTRAELEGTLDALEDKLNVPKQASLLAERVRVSYSRNPVPWIIGATAAAIAVAGTIAWAILSDD